MLGFLGRINLLCPVHGAYGRLVLLAKIYFRTDI